MFIQYQDQIHHYLQSSDSKLYLHGDNLSEDFEYEDPYSIQEYQRIIESLSPQPSDYGGNDGMFSSAEEDGLTSEEEGSVSDESDIESDSVFPITSAIVSTIKNEEEKIIAPLSRRFSALLPTNSSPHTLQIPTIGPVKKRNRGIRRKRGNKEISDGVTRGFFEFNSQSQVVGITYLEIVSCTDLPPLSNMTRTGFDMDPFVVVSFGKKTFRTDWRRHTLNPVFNETLMFPVLNLEKGFSINFTVMDKDKFSLNDHVATADFSFQNILETSPQPNPQTLLYDIKAMGMQYYPSSVSSSKRGSASSLGTFQEGIDPSCEDDYSSDDSAIPSDGMGYSSQGGYSSTTSLQNLPVRSQPLPTPNSACSSSISGTNRPSSVGGGSPTLSNLSELQSPTAGAPIQQGMARRRKIGRNRKRKPSVQDENMVEFSIPLTLMKAKYSEKHSPVLKIRARFLPYAALRQQFWRGLIKLYDANESYTMDIFEVSTMLDQIGATLSPSTVDGFFTKFGKTSGEQELTIDELVICLEEQMLKDTMRHAKNFGQQLQQPQVKLREPDFGNNDSAPIISVNDFDSNTPAPSEPVHAILIPTNESQPQKAPIKQISAQNAEPYVIDIDGLPSKASGAIQNQVLEPQETSSGSEVYSHNPAHFEDHASDSDNLEERLIRVAACPFCGQPRLDNKAEIDIVTHLATCASQNWTREGLLSMRNYVSSNQARKRWYTKVMFKVTYGNYKLGANSANILVQDRETGYIQEEKMNVYVRLGIRLLYKGLKSSSMESRRIRKILKNASVKQGRKYDDPTSAAAIAPFIKFHGLDLDEVLLPLSKFTTFNEFFYRKLKPGARVCDAPDNERIVVSPADCRSTCFPTISKATQIWIKGKDFSIARLFGDAYPDMVDKFVNGSLAIFRLAPQDYHRFHIPVSGVLGEPKAIDGEYYTVNPMAIRSALDVYGENVRVLVPIQSDEFGLVMIVCVGAMMVGSTVITRKAGERVERMEELGYFKFGGSTVVVLFEQNQVKFDKDLDQNSQSALETLIKVGMSIGHSPGINQFQRENDPKPTQNMSPDQIEKIKEKAFTEAEDDTNMVSEFMEGFF